MSELYAIPEQPLDSENRAPVLDSLGQIVIGFWQLFYWIRRHYLGGWIAFILAAFSAVELISPLLHEWLAPLLQIFFHRISPNGNSLFWKTSQFHSLLLVVLVFASIIMFIDHHRLKKANRGYRRLIAYLKWLTENDWARQGSPVNDRFTEVLNGLIEAIDGPRKHARDEKSLLSATLICTRGCGEKLFILAQDSKQVFDANNIALDPNSVAGVVAARNSNKPNSGYLIYVPWTKCTHGVSLEYRTDKKDAPVEVSGLLPRAYRRIDDPGQKQLGSLLCIRVELPEDARIDALGDTNTDSLRLVLSISAPHCFRLGSQVFDAARLVSKFLPQVLK
jgi:hypothetical protein